jgi:hypothetical protein
MLAKFARSAAGDSSNEIIKLGSSNVVAPFTRYCMAKTVLPLPGPPTTIVVRPIGKPPRKMASSPVIPLGDVSIVFLSTEGWA